MDFIDVLEQLRITSSTNAKIDIIKANSGDAQLKQYLQLALDKNITFGVSEIPMPDHIDSKYSFAHFYLIATALSKRELTGNNAMVQIFDLLARSPEREAVWFRRCLQKDLSVIGIGQRLFENAYDEKMKFRLGLAEEQSEIDKVEDGPGFLDKKANGVRTIAMLEDTKVFAIYGGRNGLLAENFYFIKDELEQLTAAFGENCRSCVYDGEVHVNDSLENTMTLYGTDMTKKAEDFILGNGKVGAGWKKQQEKMALSNEYRAAAKYVIFDWMTLDSWNNQNCKYTQKERKAQLDSIKAEIARLGLKQIEVIETEYVLDKDAAIDAAQRWIDRGFEGGIWKPEDGLYLWKRSRNWIKIKEVEDFEVQFVRFVIQKPKYNSDGSPKPNMIGKVIGIDRDGNIHEIGTGKALPEDVRQDMYENWDNYEGKIGTCSAQRPSEKGKYICPRLDIIRLDRNSLD